MLSFPYRDEPLAGLAPPSLPPGSTVRWRPLVPVRVLGPGGRSRSFTRAVFDPCADDIVFALGLATVLGISTKTAESHRTRLMQKLDIHETATLVLYAVRRGIVQP